MSTTITTAVAPLTIQDAETLVEAARGAAEAAGVAVAVSVVDAGGHLLAFRRDDRAVLIAGETSTRKAFTALQLDSSTPPRRTWSTPCSPAASSTPCRPPWTARCSSSPEASPCTGTAV